MTLTEINTRLGERGTSRVLYVNKAVHDSWEDAGVNSYDYDYIIISQGNYVDWGPLVLISSGAMLREKVIIADTSKVVTIDSIVVNAGNIIISDLVITGSYSEVTSGKIRVGFKDCNFNGIDNFSSVRGPHFMNVYNNDTHFYNCVFQEKDINSTDMVNGVHINCYNATEFNYTFEDCIFEDLTHCIYFDAENRFISGTLNIISCDFINDDLRGKAGKFIVLEQLGTNCVINGSIDSNRYAGYTSTPEDGYEMFTGGDSADSIYFDDSINTDAMVITDFSGVLPGPVV
jgi:hypothetical protein